MHNTLIFVINELNDSCICLWRLFCIHCNTTAWTK